MFKGRLSPIKAVVSWVGTYLIPVPAIVLTNLWVDFEKEQAAVYFLKSMFTSKNLTFGFPPQTVFTYLSLLLLIFGIVLHCKKPAEAPAVAPEEPQAAEQKEE